MNDRIMMTPELLPALEEAVQRRDLAAVQRLLESIPLDQEAISLVLDRIDQPDWAVRLETTRRFAASQWRDVTTLLDQLALPLLDRPDRSFDRARVKLAIIKLASGDLQVLQRWAKEAVVDWRDVLVAAGLANANWREVLGRDGYAVPVAEPR